jgi:hypothetical protein
VASHPSATVLVKDISCFVRCPGWSPSFLKQARAGQDRAELLVAQLKDAREEQTRAAAIAELRDFDI